MTSPHDEISAYASVGNFFEIQPAASAEPKAAGEADEERLVEIARQEIVLRLARAL